MNRTKDYLTNLPGHPAQPPAPAIRPNHLGRPSHPARPPGKGRPPGPARFPSPATQPSRLAQDPGPGRPGRCLIATVLCFFVVAGRSATGLEWTAPFLGLLGSLNVFPVVMGRSARGLDIRSMLVTFSTFHVVKSPLKALAPMNIQDAIPIRRKWNVASLANGTSWICRIIMT